MINDNVVEITITDAILSHVFFEYILASKKFKIADGIDAKSIVLLPHNFLTKVTNN